jgi:hypothetical protein
MLRICLKLILNNQSQYVFSQPLTGLKSRRQGLPKPSKFLRLFRKLAYQIGRLNSFLAFQRSETGLLAIVYRVKFCSINGFINFVSLSLMPIQ